MAQRKRTATARTAGGAAKKAAKATKKATRKATVKDSARSAAKKGPAATAPRRASGAAGGGRKRGASRRGPGAAEPVLESLRRDLKSVRDITVKEFERAVKETRERLSQGGYDREALNRLGKGLGESLGGLRSRIRDARDDVRERSEKLKADPRFQRAADAGLSALVGLAGTLRGLAEKMEHSLGDRRNRQAGEQAEAGSYACTSCSEVTVLTAGGPLPGCVCGAKRFRKVG